MFQPALLLAFLLPHLSTSDIPSCPSPIYCQGPLLDTIQRAGLFPDSKTFVDMRLISTPNITLANFNTLLASSPTPTKPQLEQFLAANFEPGDELEPWTPPDFRPNPALLARISDPEVKQFATDLVQVWKSLARKVKNEVFDHPDRYSLIPVRNGFIIPGGRFREFYYWDSYWIVRGLIECEMTETVRGMLENFIEVVKQIGFVPNGARVYYLNRSQPPLLTKMVEQYMLATGDHKFLVDNIAYLEAELSWWLENRLVTFSKEGKKYQLAHYSVDSPSPRPESYIEDIYTASGLANESERGQLYSELKSGAESGFDFSSRWIIDKNGSNDANLTSIRTSQIVPVDLNSILCESFRILAKFHLILNNYEKSKFWIGKAKTWQKTIDQVLYDKKDGIWYDYSIANSTPRRYFYASNFAPLWAGVVDALEAPKYGASAVKYLQKNNILDYKGGVPTSLLHTGEQWDLPNAWPPLQAFIVYGLFRSGSCEAKKMAEALGKQWVEVNMKGFKETGDMYEKYDATKPGRYGEGGEYTVQSGFGWTNGVVFDFIDLYYTTNSKRNKQRKA